MNNALRLIVVVAIVGILFFLVNESNFVENKFTSVGNPVNDEASRAMHLRNFSAPIIFLIGVAVPGIAATPPGPMMANVYRLTEAAAVLTVCFESPLYTKLSNDKALQLHGLIIRLADLIQNIAKHYKDDALYLTFEATRVKISSEAEMKNYVKSKYQYCGDQLFRDMEAYVSENETLINGYLKRQSRGR